MDRARSRLAVPAIAGLAVAALALNRSGADLALARLFYDPPSASFPWRSHVLFASVLHDAAKWLTVGLVVAQLAALAFAYLQPAGPLRAYRDALTYLAAASLASALVVSLLKGASGHSCPWDLSMFGGRFDYYMLLADAPAHPGPGRCLPSGHASVAFMWIAAIYARERLPASLATRVDRRLVASIVIAFGTLVGATQIVRGAHFASHVLLTAAICWGVAWTIAVAWRRPRQRDVIARG